MREKLHISLPQPCSNRWNEMSYVEDAKRHCASCDKVITDFTHMSDEQLIAHFRSNPVSCGMFAPHQLNRQIQQPKKKQSGWAKALVVPALLALTEAGAQETKPVAVVEQPADSSSPEIRIPLEDVFRTAKDTLIVTGSVLEAGDSLKQFPVFGAVILFHLSDSTTRGCVADTTGNFKIKLAHMKVGDTVNVEVRLIGYTPYFTSIVLEEPKAAVLQIQPFEITRAQSGLVGDIVIIQTPRSRVRHFFWRLFHPRSWFW